MRPLIGFRLTAAMFLLAPVLVVASPGSQAEASPAAAASPSVVTLITGERVQLTTNADGQVAATLLDVQGSSASRQAQVFAAAGHTYVVPQEAVGALGQLDLSLFDISAQVAGAVQQVQIEW